MNTTVKIALNGIFGGFLAGAAVLTEAVTSMPAEAEMIGTKSMIVAALAFGISAVTAWKQYTAPAPQ